MGHVWLEKGFECPRLGDALGSQSGKGEGMSDHVIWRRKRRGMAGEPGVKQVKGTKGTEAPTMARRSPPPPTRGWDRLVPLRVSEISL